MVGQFWLLLSWTLFHHHTYSEKEIAETAGESAIKRGFVQCNLEKLSKDLHILSNHHTSGPLHNIRVARRFLKSKVAMPKPPPWRCKWCMCLNKGMKGTCQTCETSWEHAIDHSFTFVPPKTQRQPSAQRWQEQPWYQGSVTKPPKATRKDRSLSRKERARSAREKATGEKASSDLPFARLQPFKPKGKPYVPRETQTPWQYSDKASKDAAAVTNAENGGVSAEMIEALKEDYPDVDQMPPKSRAIWDRYHAPTSKQVMSEMHRQTSIVGKAQENISQLQQSMKSHKMAWLSHLKEVVEIWEGQVIDYQTQQREFTSLIAKAKEALNAAQSKIDTLNQQVGEKGCKKEDTEIVVDDPEDENLEKELRSKVSSVLQNCVGITEAALETVDISDEDSKPTKRHRSLEPAPGSTSSTHK